MMTFCGKCQNGEIFRSGEELGYSRVPRWDTRTELGYVTPSNIKYLHPRDGGPLEFYQVCNCVRRQNSWPILSPEEDWTQLAEVAG